MENTTSGPKARRYVFSVFTFDVESGELTRNRHTERIRTQTSRLLTILLERAGTVVSRDELRELMWPDGEFLDHERSINRAVNELREVLRDDPREPKFIETLHKRGYRFRPEVKIEAVEGPDGQTLAVSDSASIPIAEPASDPIPSPDPPLLEAAAHPISQSSSRWAFVVTALLVLASAALVVWSAVWPGSRPKAPVQSKVVRMAIVPFDVQGEGAGPLQCEIRSNCSPRVRGPSRPIDRITISIEIAMNTNTAGTPPVCRKKPIMKLTNTVLMRLNA